MRDLAQIIQLRSGKLKRVQSAELERQRNLRRAQEQLVEARSAIDAFANEMRELEKNLLDGVLHKEVRAADMLLIDQILKAASLNAQRLAQEARACEDAIDTCHEELEQARSIRIDMSKKLESIKEVNREIEKKTLKARRTKASRREDEIMEESFNCGVSR